MVHLHIVQGECIALFIQSVIYGIDAAAFTMYVRIMMQKLRYSRAPIGRLFLLIAIILFALATVDVVFSLCFVAIADTSALPARPVLSRSVRSQVRILDWLYILRHCWRFLTAMISDGVLIYRCWIVYDRAWTVITVAAALWFAKVPCVVLSIVYLSSTKDIGEVTALNALSAWPFLQGSLLCTLGVTVISTGLVLYRICSVSRETSRSFTMNAIDSGRTDLMRVKWLILESALVYTVIVIPTVVTLFARSAAYYSFASVFPEAAGLSFYLVTVRTGKGSATEPPAELTNNLRTAPLPTRDVMTLHREPSLEFNDEGFGQAGAGV